MKLILLPFLSLVLLLVVVAHPNPNLGPNTSQVKVESARIKFKISGRDLPDADYFGGTTDGYVEVSLSEDNGNPTTRLGKTNTVHESENPDWSTVLEFNFDRSKNQMLHFFVKDQDHFPTNNKVGIGFISAAELVDKGGNGVVEVQLDKKGYLQLLLEMVDS